MKTSTIDNHDNAQEWQRVNKLMADGKLYRDIQLEEMSALLKVPRFDPPRPTVFDVMAMRNAKTKRPRGRPRKEKTL